MNDIREALVSVLRADSPLAYAGSAATVICAAWILGLLVWGCRRIARETRARRAETPAAGRPLPQVATISDVRILRHTVRGEKTSRRLDRVGQIEPNQPVRVMVDDGRGFDTFVLDAKGNDIRLALPMAAVSRRPISSRKNVRLVFARSDDARYRVTSRVLDAARNDGSILVRAVETLKRVQERSEFRVRCNSDMRFGRIAAAPVARRRKSMALPEEARLQDISVGGASFVCDAGLDAGARIVVQLADPHGELRLAGRVLRQKELGGTSVKKFRTCVEFPALSAAEERRLGRFVTASQQQMMRRMAERVAPKAGRAAAIATQVAARIDVTADRKALSGRAPGSPSTADRKEGSAMPVGK